VQALLSGRIPQMALPPLYKYLDVRGAKLTLGNGTFRHAKPSDFNDVEDLTIQTIFPEEIEQALKRLENSFTDVVLQHLNDPPTCGSPMREKLAAIQHVYRTNPKAIDIVKAELKKGEPIYDVEHMRERAKVHIKDINEFMQSFRILCVSTRNDSEKMWIEYAENHKGVVLRIEPNIEKDSKFQLFRPVAYGERRPPLYDDTVDFIAQSLFGNLQECCLKMMEKIIYSKTSKWEHENEYRLAIPLGENEEPYDTLKYHPEEVTELYLGACTANEDKDDIFS
jgi:hypothetical protein